MSCTGTKAKQSRPMIWLNTTSGSRDASSSERNFTGFNSADGQSHGKGPQNNVWLRVVPDQFGRYLGKSALAFNYLFHAFCDVIDVGLEIGERIGRQMEAPFPPQPLEAASRLGSLVEAEIA
jgi:hypothetical protein